MEALYEKPMAARAAQVSENREAGRAHRGDARARRRCRRRKGYPEGGCPAATRFTCAPANMTTAVSAIFIDVTTRRRRARSSSTTSRSRSRSACNTACRWKICRRLHLHPLQPAGPVQQRQHQVRDSILDSPRARGRLHVALRSRACHPNETSFDALGKGVEEGKEPDDSQGHQATKYLSKGLTRSRTDNLVIMRGGSMPASSDNAGGRVTALASHGATSRAGDAVEGAVALKQEAQHDSRRPKSWKPCNGARPAAPRPPPRPRPNAAPKPRQKATRARCAASAATSRWFGMGRV